VSVCAREMGCTYLPEEGSHLHHLESAGGVLVGER
jgi:hypothetical protein